MKDEKNNRLSLWSPSSSFLVFFGGEKMMRENLQNNVEFPSSRTHSGDLRGSIVASSWTWVFLTAKPVSKVSNQFSSQQHCPVSASGRTYDEVVAVSVSKVICGFHGRMEARENPAVCAHCFRRFQASIHLITKLMKHMCETIWRCHGRLKVTAAVIEAMTRWMYVLGLCGLYRQQVSQRFSSHFYCILL